MKVIKDSLTQAKAGNGFIVIGLTRKALELSVVPGSDSKTYVKEDVEQSHEYGRRIAQGGEVDTQDEHLSINNMCAEFQPKTNLPRCLVYATSSFTSVYTNLFDSLTETAGY